MASKVHLWPRWLSLISEIRGASYGIAFMLSARLMSLSSSTKMNSASLSTNRLISHGHATRSTFTFFLVIHFISYISIHWLFSNHVQVIEQSYGIRLGPQANLSRITKGIVRCLDLLLAIEVAGNFVPHGFYSNLVPFSRGHFNF